MSVFSRIRILCNAIVHPEDVRRQVESELAFHVETQTKDLISRGMPEDKARRRTLAAAGRADTQNEKYRDAIGLRLYDEFAGDLGYGLRQLRRNPAFTALAIITLAIGIGATSAIFCVINGVLLQPLPYPQPNQLVSFSFAAPSIKMMHLGLSPSMYFVFREESRTFHHVSLYDLHRATVTGVGEPEVLDTLDATEELLPTLGVRPVLGREFTLADDQPDSPRTVMLSYWYWRRKFGNNRSVIGDTIDVDGKMRQIIGVLPKNFSFLDRPGIALILPFRLDRAKTELGDFEFGGIARLSPGVTVQEADGDVARMLPIVARSFPPPSRFSLKMYESVPLLPHMEPLKNEVIGNIAGVLWLLMGGISLVLLIACANVANLLLARMESRRQEFAIRRALGASPRRIARQLLLESFVLSFGGAALGLSFAYAALKALIAIAPSTLPRLSEIRIDTVVLLFTAAISLTASLLFGSMAVLRFAGRGAASGLKSSGRSQSAGREHRRAQNVLVIVQMGLALVLLISAGLMVRTFRALIRVQPGFTALPANIESVRLSIPATDAPQPEQVARMQRAILHQIETVPGVSSASICSSVPLQGPFWRQPIFVRDHTDLGQEPPSYTEEFVGPGFFRTLGVPIVAGRDFTWDDIYGKRPVVLVSRNLAREYWGNSRNAIDKQLRIGANDEWHEIVGVVGDVHVNGMNEHAPREVYWPIMAANMEGKRVVDVPNAALVINSARAGSESFAREIRRAVHSVDPNLPLEEVDTMEYFYRQSMASTSFGLIMLALASGMALLLGAVGLYGVISYSVSQRTHEMGIRMALGAQTRDVLRLIMRQGMTLSLLGVVIGVVVALGVTRFLSNLLYGVKPTDPLTFFAIPFLLMGVALLACYIPARRATKVDPTVSLRYE